MKAIDILYFAVFPTLSDDLPTELATFQRHPITLPCGGSGDPRPAIVWYKDGTRLPIDGKKCFICRLICI